MLKELYLLVSKYLLKNYQLIHNLQISIFTQNKDMFNNFLSRLKLYSCKDNRHHQLQLLIP